MFMFAYIEVTQDITTSVIPLEAVRIPYRKGLTRSTPSIRIPTKEFPTSKSLHSRKSFVLVELSFARMPSRQYCLKVNKVHCCN